MQLASACGLDTGEDLHSISPRQGLEWEPWRALSSQITKAVGGSLEPKPGWANIDYDRVEQARRRFRPKISALDFPEVVKFPEQGQACLIDLLSPGHVIVAVRDPEGWYQSMHYQNGPAKTMGRSPLLNGQATKTGRIILELEAADLPYTVVHYPRVVRVKGYAETKLGPLMGDRCGEMWERTVNHRWDRRRS
jgi:hypothetical protein